MNDKTAETDAAVIEELKRLVGTYSCTEDGQWLSSFSWLDVPVEFADLKYGICGMYSFGKILLLRSGEAKPIFSIYVHELRHRWQWRFHPLRYIIGKLYRPLIEDDADAEEKKAEKWIGLI